MIKVSNLKEWATFITQSITKSSQEPILDFTYAPLEEIKEYLPLRTSLVLVVNKSVTSKAKNAYDVILYKNHFPVEIQKEFYRTVQVSEDNKSQLTIYLILDNIIDRSYTKEILYELEKILNTYKQ